MLELNCHSKISVHCSSWALILVLVWAQVDELTLQAVRVELRLKVSKVHMWTIGKGAVPLSVDGAVHLALTDVRLLGNWAHAENVLAQHIFIPEPCFAWSPKPHFLFFSNELRWATSGEDLCLSSLSIFIRAHNQFGDPVPYHMSPGLYFVLS